MASGSSIAPQAQLKDDFIILGDLQISFRRTIRVPDNNQLSKLPPDLGPFPLFKVKDYAARMPPDMLAKGGLCFPMYQREAMWIRFVSTQKYAIKIYVGSVNAVSGEPVVENAATILRRRHKLAEGQPIQDYIVTPDQKWLDGIATHVGQVRQFIAMPTGSGYSVEAQITGEEHVGGIQFEVTPQREVPKIAYQLEFERVKQCSERSADNYRDEMTLAAGGRIKQSIAKDPLLSRSPDAASRSLEWDTSKTVTFNVQILNTASFLRITGQPAPNTPVDAAEYARQGHPFFSIDEDDTDVCGNFKGVKSVAQLGQLAESVVIPPVKKIGVSASKAAPHHISVNASLGPEFFNPAGPRRPFRSVEELERGLGHIATVSFD